MFTAMLHFYFDTYLISPDKGFPIINSEIGMMPSKLEVIFVIKFFEKEFISDDLMIIAKVFEYIFKLRFTNIKLKVLNNRYN